MEEFFSTFIFLLKVMIGLNVPFLGKILSLPSGKCSEDMRLISA